jgi:hypothetical protein
MLAMMQNLQRRRTTKREDEPICIATLMNIDLTRFEGTPSMEDIYRALYRLPRNLIFAPSPRLNTPGVRWTPSTFLEQPITATRTNFLDAFGCAERNGFDFKVICIKLRDSLVIERNNKAYIVEFPNGEKDVFFLPDFTDYPNFSQHHIDSCETYVSL